MYIQQLRTTFYIYKLKWILFSAVNNYSIYQRLGDYDNNTVLPPNSTPLNSNHLPITSKASETEATFLGINITSK